MKDSNPPRAGKTEQDVDASALFDQYAARVFTYFQYRCNDFATAQDLTMQVFERLLRCLPEYDAARAVSGLVVWHVELRGRGLAAAELSAQIHPLGRFHPPAFRRAWARANGAGERRTSAAAQSPGAALQPRARPDRPALLQ